METKNKSPDLTKLARRLDQMNEQRDLQLPVYRDIAKYVAPGRGLFDRIEPNRGDRRDDELLDPTPALALNMLAAGMQGGMTSPSKQWFRVMTADAELADNSEVRVWCDDTERLMYWTIGRSNAYNGTHTAYSETAGFGTGAILVDDDPLSVINCRTFTAGEYSLEFGPHGRPTAFGRQYWMTAVQMREQFGEDNLTEAVKESLKAGKFNQWFLVDHLICPNEDYKDDSPLARNMEFLSVYWQHGKTSEAPLRVSGYREFPVMAPRWDVLGADYYGRGPGWYALGESKTLQEMRKDYLKAVKLGIQPPLWGPQDAKNQRVSLRPGDVTYSPGDIGLRSLYDVRFDVPGQLQAMADSRGQINRTFYADLFTMIAGMDNRDMTAREVAERHEEKMLMLGPVLERLETELLTPFLNRVFMILDRRGMIPPPPDVLKGQALKFEYISLLAQAQQMVGLVAIDRLVGFVGQVAGANPSVLDKLDFDECVDQYAQKLGAPARVVRGDEVVAEMRQQQAAQAAQMREMAAMQQAAQTAETGTKAVKDLADAPMQNGGSALDALVGGGGESM